MLDSLDDGAASASTDPIADAEFANPTTEMSKVRISGQAVPGFPFYIAKPASATLAYRFDDREAPIARIRWVAEDGPEESVGNSFFTDLRLYVSRQAYTDEKDENGRAVTVPKSAKELAEDIASFQKGMNRLAYALGFKIKMPASKQKAALEAYVAQFGNGAPAAVVDVRRNQYGNSIWFDGVRALTEPAFDAKLAAQGKTALDEAKLAIEKRNKAAAQRAGKGGVKRSATGSLD